MSIISYKKLFEMWAGSCKCCFVVKNRLTKCCCCFFSPRFSECCNGNIYYLNKKFVLDFKSSDINLLFAINFSSQYKFFFYHSLRQKSGLKLPRPLSNKLINDFCFVFGWFLSSAEEI